MSPFNLFTNVKWEQLFFGLFFFTVSHNGTKWLWLAQLRLAAKRPQCREEEKVWNRHCGRENSAAILSVILRELAPFHLSWYKHYFFFFLFQQRIREALTGATDGLGSHRLQKYLEVYTSQTQEARLAPELRLLFEGKHKKNYIYIYTAHFAFIFLQLEVWILCEWQHDERSYRNSKLHQAVHQTHRCPV